MTGSARTSLARTALVLCVGLALVPCSVVADEGPGAPAAKEAGAQPQKASIARVPMLWEVDTEPKIYLFGTIHLGDPRVLAHPPVVARALARSQALYTEIEMTPEALMRVAPLTRLPQGQSLAKLLPPQLHARVLALFRDKGVPEPVLAALDRMQIWAIYLELARLDVDPKLLAQALDRMLYEQAQAAGKTVGALETIDEQLDIFRGLSTQEQITMLGHAVDGIEEARKAKVDPIGRLLDLYLAGDADNLMQAMIADLDQGDALSKKLMKRMLDDRNVRMVKRMLQKAQSHPDKTTFVAVGAGHYPGAMGILELLRKTGFRVRQLETVADMDKPWPLAWGSRRPPRCVPRRQVIRVGPFCLPDPCAR